MEILKNKIVDVSTPKKLKKALEALIMFKQDIRVDSQNYKHITYFSHINKWVFVSWDHSDADLIQPSELKKILAKELLKEDDGVIIEGPKPKRARWIVSINKIEYYGDAGLKFLTHYATGLNNPSYRHGSAFSGKFIRFATNDEVAKLVEEVALNTHTETIDTPSTNTIEKAWLHSLIITPQKKVFFGKNNDIPVYKKQVTQNHTKSEYFKNQQCDLSIWGKTCFIPTITPLPPFLEVLKIDIQQKRVKLEKEFIEPELSNLAVYQLGLDLVDTIKFHLSFKTILK